MPDPSNGLDFGRVPDDLKTGDAANSIVVLFDAVLIGVAAFVSVRVSVLVEVMGGDWVGVHAGDVTVLEFVAAAVANWEAVRDIARVCERVAAAEPPVRQTEAARAVAKPRVGE